jgi:beta-glucosidase
MPFPPGFLWGAATASYQIEGAVSEGGRGESIWDRFSHTPGNIEADATGDIADDHYHRYREDIDLMAELGLKAYRFSIAWPRLFPDGGGQLNQAGLDFYQRLVDRLLERGIAPMATLYHWDLPQALQDRQGGWVARDTASRFADYATAVFGALGDRVGHWVTLNEPWVSSFIGYHDGRHAPGVRDLTSALRAAHHLYLGHAAAVASFRALGLPGEIGITLNLNPSDPATDRDEDERAAILNDGNLNRWFLDPLFRGSYPADMVEHYVGLGADLDFVESGDLEAFSRPIDFLGVNYYFRNIVTATSEGLGWDAARARAGDEDLSNIGWAITPDGLRDILGRVRTEYTTLPTYVTENGIALDDTVGADGSVHDPRRIDYLAGHFAAAEAAIADGTDLRGYFVWTLLDNFEWAAGYRPRFGLVYVDFETQARIPKSSAAWYAGVIRANGLG